MINFLLIASVSDISKFCHFVCDFVNGEGGYCSPVHSNVAKNYSRLPAAMEFWLVCLGILAYSCQNTSEDSGV